MANKIIGGITVTISASTQPFIKGISLARKTLTGFTSAVKNTIFSVKGLTAALTGGALVGTFGILTKNAFATVDAMGELSDKLGVSTKDLAGLQLAADEAGVSSETLERAMVTLNKKGMGGVQGLRDWIDKTGKLSTHQEKLAAATEMFGSRGSSMVRMLTGGVAALDEAQKAAESMGLSLDRSAVAGVERAIDAFGRLKKSIQGIFVNVATELAPYIELLSTKLTKFIASGEGAKGIGRGIADVLIKGVGLMVDGIQAMVSGVLSLVADIKDALLGFRTSGPARAMGLGLTDDQAIASRYGAGGAYEARKRAIDFRSAKPWSQAINDTIAAMRAEAAKTPDAGAGSRLGALSSLLGGVGSGAAKGLGGLGSPIMAFGQSMAAQSMMRLKLGQMFNFAPGADRAMKPSFSLAESGSADSYRQQAAIRRQADSLPRKSLKVQESMLATLNKIERKTAPQLMAANF